MSLRIGVLLLPVVVAALAFACGGDSERSLSGDGASPSPSGTAPIFQRSPVRGTPSPASTPAATTSPSETAAADVNVTPVSEPFEITVDEAINVRSRPSTSDEATILAVIYPGQKAKVVGEARGQEVEAGKGDLWYQVELTSNGASVQGFLYAAFVEKVE